MHRHTSTPRFLIVAAAGLLASVGVASECVAQEQRIAITTSLGGPRPGSQRITKKSLEHYCDMLGLNEEQRESALAMFEGYQSACSTASTEHRAEMQKLQKQAQEDDDHTVFMEKMPEIMAKNRERTRKIDDDFLGDLKLIAAAAPDADARWQRVEQARRRDTLLRMAAMSGEGIDLSEIVREFKLDAKALEVVQPELLEYENELDKHLQAKESLMARQERDAMPGLGGQIDMEKMQAQMTEMRDVGSRIKDTNEKHARRVTDLLPEERREAFAKLVRARSFPRVYRDSKVAKDMSAALGLSDLTPAQKESLDALKASYEREIAPINDAWASAIEAKEKAGQSGMISAGGAMMVMDFGDEPEDVAAAKKSKRELDKGTREKLEQILTPEQREKLPKESPEAVEGGAVMITGGSVLEFQSPR